MSLKPARKGRISFAETLRRNQSAMDLYADLAGKPRVERFAPEKRAAPTPHDPANGKLERDVKDEVFLVLRGHPDVAWFARVNSGEFVVDERHIKAYSWYSPDTKGKSSGIGDFIGQFTNGVFFCIECKREIGGTLSEDQRLFIGIVTGGNGRAAVVRSAAETLQFLNGKD